MKKTFKYLLFPLLGLLMTGCSSGGSKALSGEDVYPSGYDSGPTGYVEGDIVGGDVDIGVPEAGDPVDPVEEPEPFVPEPGQLTCSALDDNKYYDFWVGLSKSTQEGKGTFQSFREKFAFNTFNRIDLTIKNGSNISVKIKDDKFSTKVDNLNKAYLFPQSVKEQYEVEISYLDKNDQKKTIETVVTDGQEIDLEEETERYNNLQIMFVIDATGSMGDEMNYIKSEIDDVISKIKENNPEANITLATMVYRDKGDDYVVKYKDFTTNIASQQQFLSQQRADGGGDFEEAVQEAMKQAMEKQWSEKATKLLFHVADAPSHDEDVASWNNSALLAAQKGIKIISVASSGIDKKTEYFFRSQSLLTAGQYVYLTNDSGIGGDHLEATVEEKLTVEYLNACLIRLIDGYYTGTFSEPVPYKDNSQQQ